MSDPRPGVAIERRGPVTLLTLANPAKRNALDPALCDALAAAIGDLAAAGARAAVLTGAGDRAFCAGFDLEALSDDPAVADRPFTGLLDAVAASPVPIVAALNGATHGGGCELAAACDVRVAHAGVKLGMPPARLGIVYAPRGLARFVALVGESRARELFLTARVVDAGTAHGWGLVDHVVPTAEVLARALAIADEIAALAPLAVQGMRRVFEALLDRRATLAADQSAAPSPSAGRRSSAGVERSARGRASPVTASGWSASTTGGGGEDAGKRAA